MPRKKQVESGIKKAVIDFLRWHKWYVMTIQNGPFGTKGVCDLIACRKGETCFIEIKTEKGVLSNDQQIFRREIIAHAGWHVLIREIDIDWFKTLWG